MARSGAKQAAMADDVVRPRLGRGLAALIGDVGDEASAPQRKVAVEFLRPNPRNPRRRFDDPELDALAASIRQRGIIQPIVARALEGVPDTYEIVAGERRWRAAQRAGLHEVPVVVVEIDDRTSLEYAVLENVQRADLNAIEEAAGYERLMTEFGYSQSGLAEILGKSRSHLANTLRLLQLPGPLQDRLIAGEISAGHGRALLSVSDPDAVARRIVAEGLSVRDVEALGSAAEAEEGRPGRPRRASKDAGTRSLEAAMARALGVAVSLTAKEAGAGEIRIRYETAAELDGLCRRFKVSTEG